MIKKILGLGALIGTLLSSGKARAERLDDIIGPAMHDVAEKMQGCVKPIPLTSKSRYLRSVDAYQTEARADGKKIEFVWYDGNEQTPSDGRIGPGDRFELTTKGPGDFATYVVVKIDPNGQYKITGSILPPADEAKKDLDIIERNIELKCMLIS